jgi:LysM repeat protein
VQTIKTAVVVVLLLAVIYGVYVGINGSETPLPEEVANMQLDLDFSAPDGGFGGFSNESNGMFVSNTASSESSASGMASPAESNSSLAMTPGNNSVASPEGLLLGAPSSNGTQPNAGNLLLGDPTSSGSVAANNTPPASTGSPEFSLGSPTPSMLQSGSGPTLSLPAAHGSDVRGTAQLLAENSSESSNAGLQSPTNSLSGTTRLVSDQKLSNGIGLPADFSKPGQGLPNSPTSKSFDTALASAKEQIERQALRDALSTLSLYYGAPELTEQQNFELLEILDPLAGEVIFSREHYLDIPYIVGQGETLEQIAQQFEVPQEILARINGIEDPKNLTADTKLKIVPGPFRAEVNLESNELTLFLNELYAGRFPISLGGDPTPREGVFQVVDKQRNRNYYGLGGTQISGTDPRNPYGGHWMDLGQDMCIHGSPNVAGENPSSQGCIGLAPEDAEDLFGMLGRGSQIQIQR